MNKIEVADEELKQQVTDIIKNQVPEHHEWFRVGDLININGKIFRVKGVKPTEIRLKLVPRITK